MSTPHLHAQGSRGSLSLADSPSQSPSSAFSTRQATCCSVNSTGSRNCAEGTGLGFLTWVKCLGDQDSTQYPGMPALSSGRGCCAERDSEAISRLHWPEHCD